MLLSEVYLGLGQDTFAQLIRGISIGKLKTYQIYEGFKVRAHLHKVNTEVLRKAIPRFWMRLGESDEDFAVHGGLGSGNGQAKRFVAVSQAGAFRALRQISKCCCFLFAHHASLNSVQPRGTDRVGRRLLIACL